MKVTPEQLRASAAAMPLAASVPVTAQRLRDAADLIEQQQAMLDAVGAGGVESLRKRAPSEEMRALRLWHWRGVLYNRDAQAYYLRNDKHAAAERRGRIADMHVKHVQTLNDFFEVGDTAERDNGDWEPGHAVGHAGVCKTCEQ